MITPQAVTERYVSNLITNGRNKDFDIDMIQIQESRAHNVLVGYYYQVRVMSKERGEIAFGATISQAVRRALEGHGVTFR